MANKITILCVGKVKEKSFVQLCDMYRKRIRHSAQYNEVEIKDSNKAKEGERLLEYLKKEKGLKIALSEEGKMQSSVEFSKQVEEFYGPITFVIGGPTGLDEPVKKACDKLMALSPMTWTHECARMLLLEQIFRAYAIIAKTGYHKV